MSEDWISMQLIIGALLMFTPLLPASTDDGLGKSAAPAEKFKKLLAEYSAGGRQFR